MRAKAFINKAYFLEENPFPTEAIVRWGDPDPRSNGALFGEEVFRAEYEEAVGKFIVNPIDTGSKFHFLWSLGSGDEARGFGKTATLHYLARAVNRDLGRAVLTAHEFAVEEARQTPILAAMAAFNTQGNTTLSGVSLDHVRYLAQEDDGGVLPLERLRQQLIDVVTPDASPDMGGDVVAWISKRLRDIVRRTEIDIRGKTIGPLDKKFVELFTDGDLSGLRQYLIDVKAGRGYDLLHTLFVIARAAQVRRIFLLIDQVEDFASVDVPRKRRHLEVERFRDLAIETQPFGEMASYVLTMHPQAARTIDEFWNLARLPRLEHSGRQAERVTVILKGLRSVEQAVSLLRLYLERYRSGTPPDPLFPFTTDAVEAIRSLSGGRPGEILRRANQLVEDGAMHQVSVIDAAHVQDVFSGDMSSTGVSPRRRVLGAIDTD